MNQYNVIWDSPSEDYNGSMPIGNGDLAANVWVEPSGDLIFLVSKSDAWSGGNRIASELLKLGRIRVQLDPPLYSEGATFRQELDLEKGSIRIQAAGGGSQGAENLKPETRNLKPKRIVSFWIDAHRNVIHVEVESSSACSARVALESWRAEGKWLVGGAQKDVILPTDGQTIRWYQRNIHSILGETLDVQHLGHLAGTVPDPLINRTFGGLIGGTGWKAADDHTLVSAEPAERHHLRIHALTGQTDTPEAWLTRLEQQRKDSDAVPLDQAWAEHQAWWQAFWNRSYIHITGTPEAEEASRAYQLQRWVQAGAGRGAYPINFNGSLFTVDGIDGHWANPEGTYSGPDYRRWGGAYWWQNTRLIYWPMLAAGDYDMMMPLFRMYRDMLPLMRERTRHYFRHDGVFFSETMHSWGLQRNNDFGVDNPSFTAICPYTRWEWQGGLELSAMMLDTYRHTLDAEFAREFLLPIASDVVRFYDQHYPRNNRSGGTLVITPAQALETWHNAVDPTPEVAGLQVVVRGLLALPDELTTAGQREEWSRFEKELPPIPVGEEEGKKWIKPARIYDDHRNGENPELYTVFPYQTHMVGKPDLEIAMETFHRRRHKDGGGWQQNSIQAAMLGLTDEAERYLITNIRGKVSPREKKHIPESRFPAFWGPYHDWTPNQCHAGVIVTTIQRMLMVTDDRAIRLLPAWPDDWNASFRLHAPYQTVVEGRVEHGEIVDLKVAPESRRKDVVW